MVNATQTIPTTDTKLTWRIPAPLALAVELADGAEDPEADADELAFELPVNGTLSDAMGKLVVVEFTVIPVPLVHNGLPGAPAVKLTPAHYHKIHQKKGVLDTKYHRGVVQ